MSTHVTECETPPPQHVKEETANKEKEKESEKILFSCTAYLFRYKKEQKEWAFRGKGEFKVSQDERTKKHRIYLIREKIFKFGCNHYITEDLVLEKYDLEEHCWMWTTCGDDCGDGLGAVQKFVAKFPTEETAKKFYDTVNQVKEGEDGGEDEAAKDEKDQVVMGEKDEDEKDKKDEPVKSEKDEKDKDDAAKGDKGDTNEDEKNGKDNKNEVVKGDKHEDNHNNDGISRDSSTN